MIKEGLCVKGGVGVVRRILNYLLYIFGMSASPDLPWYVYTPLGLSDETERVNHWKL